MWDFDVGTLDGVQYAFAVDSKGAVSVFDLTTLFGGEPLQEVTRWELPPDRLDGFVSPITDVHLRAESDSGQLEHYLYLAASRHGIIKLRVDVSAGGLRLEHVRTINTPSQATGLIVGEFEIAGQATDARGRADRLDVRHDERGPQPREPLALPGTEPGRQPSADEADPAGAAPSLGG